MEAHNSLSTSRFSEPLSRILIAIRNTKKDELIRQFSNEATRETAESEVTLKKDGDFSRFSNLNEDGDFYDIVNIAALINSVDTVLIGKTFLGRIIVEPYVLEAVVFLAEDPQGDRAVRIEVIQDSYVGATLFSKGAIVALRNPCFTRIRHEIYGLQYRSLTDVMVFEEKQFRIRYPNFIWSNSVYVSSNSALSDAPHVASVAIPKLTDEQISNIRNHGNKLFKEGKYSEAAKEYSTGLSSCPLNEDLLSNRSLCYLKSFEYEAALEDALLVLKRNPIHVKAIYRSALAYNGLKKYEHARDLLESKLKLIQHGQAEDLKSLLNKTIIWVSQGSDGLYDMVELFTSFKKRVYHDIADFWGSVEVEIISGRGRGLVATENVEAGQLLLCHKAVAIQFSSSNDGPFDRTEIYLARKIQESTKDNPDLFEQMVELNRFSKTRKTLSFENKESLSESQKYQVIQEVVSEFSVSFTLSDGGHFCGLWYPACYLNNDCYDTNCADYIYGDACQIRATKNVKKGEQFLICYLEQGAGHFARIASFSLRGLECHCGLCTYESRENQSILLKREGLLFQVTNGFIQNPAEIKSIIQEIKYISRQSPYVNYYLSAVLIRLAKMLYCNQKYEEALQVTTEFMDISISSGGHTPKVLHENSYILFKCYLNKLDVRNAFKWKKSLLDHLQLTFGCSTDKFLETVFPSILSDFQFLDALTESARH